MKIREYVLLIGLPLALALFLSLTYIEMNMTKGAVETSLKLMVDQKEQAFNKMLEILVRDLEIFCRDWAIWDDTYEFISNRNERYIESNLGFNTFLNAKINLMVFLDKKGEIVFSKFYDSEWNEKDIPPVFLSQELLGRSGYLLLNGSPLLFTSEQIKRSDGSGEPNGYLLVGRIISYEEIEEFGKILGVKAEIVPFEGEEVIDGKVVSYLGLEDLLGNKFFVRMEQENPLKSFYLNSLLTSIGSFGLLSFAVLVVSVLIVDRGIVSKIMKLEEFTRKANPKDRIELSGSEEFVNLAKGVNSMLERIEKDEEELRFLLKILRHDLLNVFTGIKGYLELYKSENDPIFLEKAEKYIDRGVNVIKVVKQLEAGEMREFEIRKVVEELSKMYAVEVEVKGDAKVIADDGIYTVFGNLIENAIEHGKATKIFVEIEKSADRVTVRFSDNGSGFTENARNKAFKESYSEKGSGLGLFIVKKLMEKYGGTVELQGKNTLVLSFPLRG
ncbi:MAG: hypothetical protein PWQ58_922 [Archaeoglobaceae archaeon]|nr:hypothetical protein [Archaeoglobaceae archaeon]